MLAHQLMASACRKCPDKQVAAPLHEAAGSLQNLHVRAVAGDQL